MTAGATTTASIGTVSTKDQHTAIKGLSGNDDPNASNGIFLLEINEFKRVFSDITYYTGTDFI